MCYKTKHFFMNIYERIKQDHEKHRDLLDKIADTQGNSDERKQWFSELKKDVKSHANAEEQTFYAALIEKQEGQEKARHSIVEHEEANELFDELEDMDMSNPHWLPKFKELRHELEHHMEEEEEEVFVLARKLLNDSEAESMTPTFNERKKSEKKEVD